MNSMPNTARSASPPSAPPVVLIANSDSAARSWIEATVHSAGLAAFAFESASALLSSFIANAPACAILDTRLCDADGFALQDELSRRGITVVFLTREGCVAASVRAIKAGAIDFLTLPCDAADLISALRQAVHQARSLSMRREHLSDLRCRHDALTPREREVFALVVRGMRNKQIAYQLDISGLTVQIHRGQVMRKMQASSLAALVRMADALQASPPISAPHRSGAGVRLTTHSASLNPCHASASSSSTTTP